MSTTIRFGVLVALLGGVTACTVKDTPAPPLAGPSELALRVALQVVPDSILQDGASQAVLNIEASNGNGAPARGLGLRVEILVDGVVQDFGTLSAKSVTTGEDGRTRVTYTAPPRPAEPVDENRTVSLRVTPIGTDYVGEIGRTVALRLVTPGVLLPPNTAPVAAFAWAPSAPLPLQNVVFDASASTDDDQVCGSACTYSWDFGDGTTGSGVFINHQFPRVGTYNVRLTVTDSRGASSTLAQAVAVGDLEEPTSEFTFSPSAAIATGQTIFFNAEASRPASGRRIVSYQWNFGDGRSATGMTTTKSYENPGSYTVTLSVTDDAGSKGTSSQTVTVGTVTGLLASLSVTPSTALATPAALSTVFLFDASGSSGPSRIVEYRFSFGDGSPDAIQTTVPTWQYKYGAAGIYNARVTVRDVTGRTATASRTIHVQ